MDFDHIFNLFNSEGDDSDKILDDGFKREIEFDEFKTTPLYKLGMFEKMILNHDELVQSITRIFQNSNDPIDLPEVEEAGEFIAYTRAWEYIRECELNDICWVEGLLLRDSEYLLTAVKMAISYFEGLEEYEKCSFLKKIQLFLEDNLESQS